MKKEKKLTVRKMAIIGVLGAISIVLGMTPLAFIPVGPTRATILHIPVIIGAILEGPVVGVAVGLIFGLSSWFNAMTNPLPTSFVFLNPLVSVLPRVLIGISTYYVYNSLKKLDNKKITNILYLIWIGMISYLSYFIYRNIKESGSIWIILMNLILIIVTLIMAYYTHTKAKDNRGLDVIIATIVGTLTNTVGVLFMIYIMFGEKFVEAIGGNTDLARKIILGIGVTNGIPEVIIAIIITSSVVGALQKR